MVITFFANHSQTASRRKPAISRAQKSSRRRRPRVTSLDSSDAALESPPTSPWTPAPGPLFCLPRPPSTRNARRRSAPGRHSSGAAGLLQGQWVVGGAGYPFMDWLLDAVRAVARDAFQLQDLHIVLGTCCVLHFSDLGLSARMEIHCFCR
ncbi:hypothetical protein BDA96_07G064800 [Sorghum bicolor]|uniref:Uncharacterized protein n=2 Tax=Sorghum bicolor TaxID=4558 RepID=A0A921QIW6_SORBI|nr:ubiquitin carboxyl-terminal hydrolase 51-like [Sorghum bicolor]KAG0522753.1 hypothetical protein BDA96_07G064800 [Sorghum bicolor]KXG24582.1 hypothetical protein SORBI_3007G061900 [Sorghum bicolor]|eukprot:XP_021320994.1 ubiquitin carboxyl-terminal hydrolase 51-like [Sorghum bicolor]